MRLSDTQIKEGFLHPSRIVRDAVASYFEGSFTRDPEVTHYVMRGVEQYGWDQFLTWPNRISAFPIADDASLEWLSQQLLHLPLCPATDSAQVPIRWHVESMLETADLGLLDRHDFVLRMDTLKIDERIQKTIRMRLLLTELEPEECWQVLEDHCQEAAGAKSFDDADIPLAVSYLEPLAHNGDQFVPRILEALQRPPVSHSSQTADPWRTGLMIMLAGRMRLDAAVPLLWKLWDIDWDWYAEEVLHALSRIASRSVSQLLRQHYRQGDLRVRNYASGLLEHVHCDGIQETIEELLSWERNNMFRGTLGVAASTQFDDRMAEVALRVWNENPKDLERDPIRQNLVAFSYLSGWELPERGQWEAELKAVNDRLTDSSPDGFMASMIAMAKKLGIATGNPPGNLPVSRPVSRPVSPPVSRFDVGGRPSSIYMNPPRRSPVVPSHGSKVGRNDPCPCRSGKKYKKCCMN